jgi:hypothetical protein
MSEANKPAPLTKGSFKTFDTNPFMTGAAVKTKKKNLTVARGTALVDAESGEQQMTTTIAQIKHVDEEQFVKIFSSQIKMYFDLTQPGFKVFMLLMGEVQKAIGVDKVYMTHTAAEKAAKAMGNTLSRSVFDRGVIDLCANQVIALSDEKGWYFINPAILFNGDRARFVTEFRKKRAGEQADLFTDLATLPAPTSPRVKAATPSFEGLDAFEENEE